VVSVDTGMRYIRAVEAMFGDAMIEDLPINYFCVSCNLSRAKVVTHRSGPLARWILASMSVPGVAPPYVLDGELLVDGGVLNNLPTDIARADGGGRVVGVEVSPEVDLTLPPEYNGRPSNLEVLRSRLPGRQSYPGLLAVLNRVSTLSSTANIESNRSHADLLIRMPVSGYKMFAWERIDELIELGYRIAIEELQPFTERSAT
jgi:predicted acylesterase/phospholipase RssA